MKKRSALSLYEEIMLLALRPRKGTVATDFPEQTIAGAILAELLLLRRIRVAEGRRKLVEIQDATPVGDPIIDECLDKVREAKRRARIGTWLARFAGVKQLRHKVARRLCERGIVREQEEQVLLFFTRRVYPEIDPRPEREIIERLRTAIFTETIQVDPRTIVLLSLADSADLLRDLFGKKEIKARKKRIEQLCQGDIAGTATREAIEACEVAMIVAVTIPAMVVATS